MSEFRQNFATKEWVIIAPERAARPDHYATSRKEQTAVPSRVAACPFCPGNESDTGPELLRLGDGSSWSVRVVQNKYSALDPLRSNTRKQQGLFLKADSFGDAEVVIESPKHDDTLWSLPDNALHDVLRAYRQRAATISSFPNVSIVMIFRNHGPSAGTSLEHPHSQIIASPIIPPHVRDPFQKAALHFDSFGSCVYCDIVAEELRQQERLVFENEHFVALCPFASRTPYEVRIYPRRHMAGYTWISDAEIPSFADALRFVTRRVHDLLGNPSYNFIIRSSPIGDEDVRYLHWYFVLIPKIGTPAGFEMGSGIYINPSSPEECARALRERGIC